MLETFGPRDEYGMESPVISPVDRRVAVDRTLPDGQDVYILDPDPQRFTFVKGRDATPIWSPDGRSVPYQSNESGTLEFNVVPFLGKPRPLQVSTGGGIWPRWSADGQELYYLRLNDGMLVAVSVTVKGAELERGSTRELFRPRIVSSNVSFHKEYDVDPRGRFLINVPVQDAVTPAITLVENWKPPST